MRGMIIGLSALAIASLPTLALADGSGAVTGAAGGAVAGAVVGGPVGAAVGGVAGGVIGGAASGSSALWSSPRAQARPCNTRTTTTHKQQYRRERHETDDRLSGLRRSNSRSRIRRVRATHTLRGGLRRGSSPVLNCPLGQPSLGVSSWRKV